MQIKHKIHQALQNIIEPDSEVALSKISHISECGHTEDLLRLNLVTSYPCKSRHEQLSAKVAEALGKVFSASKISVSISHKIQRSAHLNNPIANIKNIIAVSSGKGGVGKSTIAMNLALALKHEGATVGIVDADIYGPSVPLMLGSTQRPDSIDGKTMLPIKRFGLEAMSVGFIVNAKTPSVWRAPIATNTMLQLINSTNWSKLDYLIIDMPPGTGDIQLTLAQQVPISAALMVTTPQAMATQDVIKSVNMFNKVKVKVIGVVENMAFFICPGCGKQEHIFGQSGGNLVATEGAVPLLAQLPLQSQTRAQTDNGTPTVIAEPNSEQSARFLALARKVGVQLALLPKQTELLATSAV